MAEEKRAKVSGKYLEYLGRPLVREGNTICYGDLSEKCYLVLEIMSYKKESDTEVPGKILIQVIDSKDPTNILKQGQKDGLYDAFGIGVVWLERFLQA